MEFVVKNIIKFDTFAQQCAEDRNTQAYQQEAFFLELSHAFCQRLIEMGYGHDTGEEIDGESFFQISPHEVPSIPGVSRAEVQKFMDGNLEEVSAAALFRMLWEVKIVLEPHTFAGQGIYSEDYPFVVKDKDIIVRGAHHSVDGKDHFDYLFGFYREMGHTFGEYFTSDDLYRAYLGGDFNIDLRNTTLSDEDKKLADQAWAWAQHYGYHLRRMDSEPKYVHRVEDYLKHRSSDE
jgi:hypothetical protein